MRATQDDFSKSVAQRFGLARLGPGRRRLTRAQWQKEQKQAEALRTVEATARRRHEHYKQKAIAEAQPLIEQAIAEARAEARAEAKKLGEKVGGVVDGFRANGTSQASRPRPMQRPSNSRHKPMQTERNSRQRGLCKMSETAEGPLSESLKKRPTLQAIWRLKTRDYRESLRACGAQPATGKATSSNDEQRRGLDSLFFLLPCKDKIKKGKSWKHNKRTMKH